MSYIFLDESGDLGFDTRKKNSDYFLISVVSCEDKKTLENSVKHTHRTLRKKVTRLSGGILHAYKEKPVTRKRLLSRIAKQHVYIMAICLNKKKVYTRLHDEKHVLYNYVTNILLDRIMTKRLVSSTQNIVLIASRRETNKFLNVNFRDYLTHQVKENHNIALSVQIRTPAEEKGLQAADFISWALFRKYEHSDSSYYSIFRDKMFEEYMLFAPKTTKP